MRTALRSDPVRRFERFDPRTLAAVLETLGAGAYAKRLKSVPDARPVADDEALALTFAYRAQASLARLARWPEALGDSEKKALKDVANDCNRLAATLARLRVKPTAARAFGVSLFAQITRAGATPDDAALAHLADPARLTRIVTALGGAAVAAAPRSGPGRKRREDSGEYGPLAVRLLALDWRDTFGAMPACGEGSCFHLICDLLLPIIGACSPSETTVRRLVSGLRGYPVGTTLEPCAPLL